MKPESRDQFKNLVDGVAKGVSGGLPMHESAAMLCRLLEFGLERFRTIDSEEKILTMLDGLPELTDSQMQTAEGLAPMIPAAVHDLIREKVSESLQAMPGNQAGRKAISRMEKISICDEVSALIRTGCTAQAALLRVSQRVGKSQRTVRRIWSQRGSIQCTYTVDDTKAMLLAFMMQAGAQVTGETHMAHNQPNECVILT